MRVSRWNSPPIDAEDLLVDPAADSAAGDGVGDRREAAAPFRHRADVTDDARFQRHAVALPVAGEELTLETRDVDADGALGLAGAAFEAEVEHVVDIVIGETRLAEPPRHRQPQCVRAPARRVFLLPRRHIRRAHRPFERLAAGAEAAAHLDGASHAAVFAVVEERRRIRCDVAGAVAQVRRHRWCVDDLAGVEEAVRIERPLHRAERLVQHRAEHLLGERAADETVAVLAGEGAAELEHEIGHRVRDRLEHLHAVSGLQVHDRSHMQTADRGVRVDAGHGVVLAHDPEKALDVIAQLLGRHRGVFNERQRLAVALHRHRQTERRLAEAPDARLIRRRDHTPPSTAEARRGERQLQRVESRR